MSTSIAFDDLAMKRVAEFTSFASQLAQTEDCLDSSLAEEAFKRLLDGVGASDPMEVVRHVLRTLEKTVLLSRESVAESLRRFSMMGERLLEQNTALLMQKNYDEGARTKEALLAGYPYNWSNPRMRAEKTLLAELRGGEWSDGKTIVVIGEPYVPFTAFALSEAYPNARIECFTTSSSAYVIGKGCLRLFVEAGCYSADRLSLSLVDSPHEIAKAVEALPQVALVVLLASQENKDVIMRQIDQAKPPLFLALDVGGYNELLYQPLPRSVSMRNFVLKGMIIPPQMFATANELYPNKTLEGVIVHHPSKEQGVFWTTPLLFARR